ncbi:MAG: hypothetical protein KDA44_16945 [Planctomycetales bacterium]|nr:hypothetical protein [Planctomycetales bacterium]
MPTPTAFAPMLHRALCGAWFVFVLAAATGVPAGEPRGAATETVASTDVIAERDAAGTVRVRREMRLNAAGDWVRHGAWQRWNGEGNLVESGQYAAGQRTGRWTKWLAADDGRELLADDAGFALPLVSQADFQADRLDGEWVVFDGAGRRILRAEFAAGQRHGELVRWNSDGDSVLQQRYVNGLPEGPRHCFDQTSGLLTVSAEYVAGYRLVASSAAPAVPCGRRSAGMVLVGPETAVTPDDFAASQLAQYESGREVLRHGAWRTWAANGQLIMEGQFDRGRAEGALQWRHPNGQLAVVGQYAAGQPAGPWQWWDAAGTLLSQSSAGGGRSAVEVAANPTMPR